MRGGRPIGGAALALLAICCLPTPVGAQFRVPQSCVGSDSPAQRVTIAGADEPGERLTVSGRVVDGQGRPLGGHRIQVFHTDAQGYYSRNSMDETNPRLCGVMTSGEDGDYRFETIRPADYATGGASAHIHYSVWTPDGAVQRFTLRLAAEPVEAASAAAAAARAATGERTSSRRPLVRDESGRLHLVYDLELRR